MSDHPYPIVVNIQEWAQLQQMMAQQGITEFAALDDRAKGLLGDARWAVKEKAREAKCGCHITFNPPRQGKHIGRTQPKLPAPLPKP